MLQSEKQRFRIPADVSYLNCAYMAPLLSEIAAAGHQGIDLKYLPQQITTAHFFTDVEKVKQTFARVINAPDHQRVAIIPSVSYGMANAAANVKIAPGQTVILAEEQFPSNYYSWQKSAERQGGKLQVIAPPASLKGRAAGWNQRILEAINERTAAVAIGNIHWADGTLFDLAAIRQRTREVGALLIIDGSQSIGALPFDIQQLDPDALVCTGYKWLFGPYGIGLAYYGSHFDDGQPIEENWINRLDSQQFQKLVTYQPLYQPGAGRYSMGEQSNFILLPMMNAALEQILEWGVANIQEYAQRVSEPFLQQLKNLGCTLEDKKWRVSHLQGIRIDEVAFDRNKLQEELARQQVMVSQRGNAIRVSTHVCNDAHDWEKLVACFEKAQR